MRKRMYKNKIWVEDSLVMPLKEWEEAKRSGVFTNYDGSGYYAKGGLVSEDEVFSSPPLDATHVVWYNK